MTITKADVVKTGFHSEIVKLVVEYCFTDRVEIMDSSASDDLMRKMVRLSATARFFQLKGLEAEILGWMCSTFELFPFLACAAYEEASCTSQTEGPIFEECLNTIRTRPIDAFLPCDDASGKGILNLGYSSVSKLLDDDKLAANEFALFQCLLKWAKEEELIQANDIPERTSTGGTSISLSSEKGCSLSSCIRLSRIQPEKLRGAVKQSGLFNSNELLDAYETQATVVMNNRNAFLQVTEMMRCTFPHGLSVQVQGCGTDAVNGTYHMSGMFDGVPEFSKDVVWDGRMETITLLRRNEKDTLKKRWWICVVYRDGKTLDLPNLIAFYMSSSVTEGPIPSIGWRKTKSSISSDMGEDPPPTLSFASLNIV